MAPDLIEALRLLATAPADATSTPKRKKSPQPTIRGLPSGTPMPADLEEEGALGKAMRYGRTALDFTPVIGDVLSAGDAGQDLRRGDLGSAAISALAATPFVGVVGDVLKGGKKAKGAKALEDLAFPDRLYSRLGNAIEDAPFPRGTPDQWRALLSKNVSGGERQFTGIDEFLQEAGSRPIAKDEVQRAFDRGRIRLGEVVAGDDAERLREELYDRRAALQDKIEDSLVGPLKLAEIEDELHRAKKMLSEAREREGHILPNHPAAVRVRAASQAEAQAQQQIGAAFLRDPELIRINQQLDNIRNPQWRRYTQPGLTENYREVVLTLENRFPPKFADEIAALEGKRAELFGKYGDIRNFTEEAAEELDAVNTRMREINPSQFGGDNPRIYRNRTHWEGIDNPLVHVRMTDRPTAKGERALFIEELQSDWHQAGRKSGYASDFTDEQYEAAEAARDAAAQRLNRFDRAGVSHADPERQQALREYQDAIDAANKISMARNIPDAPYKKTQEWVELGLKRALDEAVKGGYDRVALPTGKQVQRAMGMSEEAGDGMLAFYDKIVPGVIRDYAKTLGVKLELEPTSMKNGSRSLSFRVTPELRDRVIAGQRLLGIAGLLGAGAAASTGSQEPPSF